MAQVLWQLEDIQDPLLHAAMLDLDVPRSRFGAGGDRHKELKE
jgi:hypothetical protein